MISQLIHEPGCSHLPNKEKKYVHWFLFKLTNPNMTAYFEEYLIVTFFFIGKRVVYPGS